MVLTMCRRVNGRILCNRMRYYTTFSKEYKALKKARVVVEYDDHISILKRIQTLSLFRPDYIEEVYTSYVLKEGGGKDHEILHTDRSQFVAMLRQISVLMSTATRKLYKRLPDINRKNRTNYYNLNHYQRFGDKIIQTIVEQTRPQLRCIENPYQPPCLSLYIPKTTKKEEF